MNRLERLETILLIGICVGLLPGQKVVAADHIEKAGSILQIAIPSVAYGATFYLRDGHGRNQFYESFVANLAVTYGLKYSIHKTRPNGGAHSFPSGHTSAAFQGASFIYRRYGLKYAIPAYIGAGFVGYSRVESNNHFTEDVLAGAAIGIASSFYFTKPYHGFHVAPVTRNGTYGFTISRKW